MTLNKRVLLSTSLLSGSIVLCAIASTLVLTRLVRLHHDGHIAGEALRHHLEADMMHDALRSQVFQAMEAARANDKLGLKAVRTEFDGHLRWFHQMMDANKALPLPEEVRSRLGKVDAPLRVYADESATLITKAAAGHIATRQELAHYGVNFKSLETAMRSTSDAIEHSAAQKQTEITAETNKLRAILLLCCIMILGFSGHYLWVLRQKVIGPIERLTRTLQQLRSGDLATEIADQDRHDEIGALAVGLEAFKTTIKESRHAEQRANELRKEHARREEDGRERAQQQQRQAMNALADRFEMTVGDVVSNVAAASSQLQATALTMSAAAEESATQTTLVSAALSDASAGVTAAAAASDEFAMSISDISKRATQSAQMARVAAVATGQADATMIELQSAADQIGHIVNLIASIAQRTNLLALNAAIEAARSGDAGHGFAVVAAEVKDLATQTCRATDDVKQQIQAIQTATLASVQALQAIGTKVGELETTSISIAAAVDEQSLAGQTLARNIDIAARSTDDVTSNIANVRTISLKTGSAASQVLDSSSELLAQATMLRQQVGDFLSQVRAA